MGNIGVGGDFGDLGVAGDLGGLGDAFCLRTGDIGGDGVDITGDVGLAGDSVGLMTLKLKKKNK